MAGLSSLCSVMIFTSAEPTMTPAAPDSRAVLTCSGREMPKPSSAADALDVGMGADAGFGDEDAVFRHEAGKAGRTVKVDRQIPQIAVVDADDLRAEAHGFAHFVFFRSFGENVKAEAVGKGCQACAGAGLEHGEHQEDGVGARCAGGEDLAFVDDDVLGDDGEGRQGAHLGETLEASLEDRRLGENGDGVGKARVDGGVLLEVHFGANDAEARRIAASAMGPRAVPLRAAVRMPASVAMVMIRLPA